MTCPPLEESMFMPEHLASCEACRREVEAMEAIAARLAPDPDEFHDPELAKDVVTLVKLGRTVEPKPQRWPFLVGPALAALLALFFLLPGAEPTGFAPRSSQALAADRWVSITPFRQTAGRPGYQPVTADLQTTDALLFSVENGELSPYRHLMIFAYDDRGEIFWYHPAYLDAATDPASIPATSGPLEEAVTHPLRPGWLRVVALFSETPLHVKAVEAIVGQAGPPEAMNRLQVPKTGQHSLLFKVTAP